MKVNIFILVLAFLFVSACLSSQNETEIIPEPSNTSLSTETKKPTNTTPPSSTPIPSKTLTPPPTTTSKPTNTPAITPTPTTTNTPAMLVTKGPTVEPSIKKTAIAYNDLSLELTDQGDYDKAIEYLDKAIELDPNFSIAYYNRGRNHDRKFSEDEQARAKIYIDNISSVLSSTSSDPPSTPTPFPDPVSISDIEQEFPLLITDEIGIQMVYIPEGSFTMGEESKILVDACSELSVTGEECPQENFEDAPPHIVYLDGFYIDQTEVSIQRYIECIDEGVCANPRGTESSLIYDYIGNPKYYEYPVNWVSPEYAEEYCNWRNARLPTEAEWEKAARGPEGRLFTWGDTFIPGLANYCDLKCILRGYNEPVPVGSHPAGASSYGVLNMAGNMAEWVSDLYDADYYSNSPEENPEGPTTTDVGHVIRGGSYNWISQNMLLPFRNTQWSNSSNVVGFRCVRTP